MCMAGIALETLADRVRRLPVGKRVGGAVYIHRDALNQHDSDLFGAVYACAAGAGVPFRWNVCKLVPYRQQVSLLRYPRFRDDAHPALAAVASLDFDGGTARIRRYALNANRPILHRKELLIDMSDPDHRRFSVLTDQEERAGLFTSTSVIGHEHGWSRQLERRGLTIRGHHLLRRAQ